MATRAERRFLAATLAARDSLGERGVLEAVAAHLARGHDPSLPLSRPAPPAALQPPAGSGPDLLGAVHEHLLRGDPASRRRAGAFYTPPALADQVAASTVLAPGRVCDPAAGGGALLLAAARALVTRHGATPAEAVSGLAGMEIDPLAADVANTALALFGGVGAHDWVSVGDALAPRAWAGTGGFDAVVANPPFRAQLQRATARSRDDAAAMSARFGSVAGGYVDDAGLFLLLAVELVRPGGMVGIILAEPVVATRDGLPLRASVGGRTELVSLTRVRGSGFDAGVRPCVLTLRRASGGVRRRGAAGGAWADGAWSALLPSDVPTVELGQDGCLADIADATADFRDQYYGITAVATDGGASGAPIVTCGLIDPARLRWGERAARIAGTRMYHPVAPIPAALRRWADARLVPKVLLATQTRILEAAADEEGCWLPLVPVITVVPRAPATVWDVLAVLLAPPVSAWAARAHAGAALSGDAIKLSARQAMQIPLPAGREQWAEAARAAQRATAAGDDTAMWRESLDELGVAMCAAYGVPSADVMAWWGAHVDRIAARP